MNGIKNIVMPHDIPNILERVSMYNEGYIPYPESTVAVSSFSGLDIIEYYQLETFVWNSMEKEYGLNLFLRPSEFLPINECYMVDYLITMRYRISTIFNLGLIDVDRYSKNYYLNTLIDQNIFNNLIFDCLNYEERNGSLYMHIFEGRLEYLPHILFSRALDEMQSNSHAILWSNTILMQLGSNEYGANILNEELTRGDEDIWCVD